MPAQVAVGDRLLVAPHASHLIYPTNHKLLLLDDLMIDYGLECF